MASQANIDLAQQLYVSYYGRPGDQGGIDFWADKFELSDNIDDALAAFGAGDEFAAGIGSSADSTILVTALYQQIFGRDPDAEGLAFYVDGLADGTFSAASAALNIANGAAVGGTDATVLANKIAVANTYTASVTANDAPYAAAQIAEAQSILAAVDATAASVTTGNAAAEAEVTGNALEVLVTAAVDAAYADTFVQISATATAGEKATADALKLTTAEDAIAAGSTQAVIDAELAVLLAADAVELAAAVQAATLVRLDDLGAAYDAEDAYLEANTVDTSTPLDGIGDGTGAELAANVTTDDALAEAATLVVDGLIDVADVAADTSYDPNDYAGAVAGVQAAILVDVTSGLAANVVAKQTAQGVAQASVDAIDGLQAAIDDVNAADAVRVITAAALDVATAAESTAAGEWAAIAAIQTDVDGELFFNGVLSVDYSNAMGIMSEDFAIVLTESEGGVAVLRAAADVAEDPTDAAQVAFVEALLSHVTVSTLITAYNAAQDADVADVVADAAVTDALDALAAVVPTDTTDTDAADALATAIDNTATAQGLVDALAAAATAEVAAYATAAATQAIDDGLTALEATISAAQSAFPTAGQELNEAWDATEAGNEDLADVFFYDEEQITSVGAIELTAFATEDNDTIYIGTGFTANAGAVATDGDDSVLEYFISEVTDPSTLVSDTTITFETSVFGSSAINPEVNEITLTGVAAADVTIADGFVTFA
jgi:hypothetical protein